ncbi:MAG TPA: DinB family protein [Gemmatimonadales bacterium]|nr:DinB family protein [Gemmatimonadales bacterium]
MIPEYLTAVITRDLRAVRREIEAYPDDESVWKLPPGIANSAGTLALHLAGNVQHFFGAVLGRSGYVRDRAAEFSRRDVPRAEIAAQLDAGIAAVEQGLAKVSEQALSSDFPEPIAGHAVAGGEWLIHLASHLAYHLGQIDYHRRLVTGHTETVGAMALQELRSARKL